MRILKKGPNHVKTWKTRLSSILVAAVMSTGAMAAIAAAPAAADSFAKSPSPTGDGWPKTTSPTDVWPTDVWPTSP